MGPQAELLLAAAHACPHGLALECAGKIIFANPAYARLLGYASPQTITGKSGAAVLKSGKARCASRNGNGRELENVHFDFRHGNRSVRLEIVLDVSARRTLERQLREAQKMEALGRVVGGVAHDFNNLLTAVMLYCDLLRHELPSDASRRHAEEINAAAEQGALLVRQLLAFARQQVLQPQVLSLNVVMQGMRDMLQRLIGENVVLVTRAADSLGKVRVDPGQIQQVILNLVVNARDAIPDGGEIVLETANVTIEAATARPLAGLRPGRWVRLSVADTGCGMDPETLAHACEPFFTTKRKGKGTGLGLATVYGIVAQSGGTLTIESHRGKGTRVNIFLPRAGESARRSARAVRPSHAANGSETVLLVEDDNAVRESAAQLLADAGYHVLQARDGTDAARVAKEHSGAVDLLVCDIVLPKISGYEVARTLRAERPEMRVLFISGYGERARRQAAELGAEVLQKPFRQAALAQRVREVLDTQATHRAAAGR